MTLEDMDSKTSGGVSTGEEENGEEVRSQIVGKRSFDPVTLNRQRFRFKALY